MALLTGDQASFTYTNGQLTTAMIAYFDQWTMVIDQSPQVFRPFGWAGPIATVNKGAPARGRLSGVQDGSAATFPIPNGTIGTLRQIAASGKYHEFKAIVYAVAKGANSTTAEQQRVEYEYIQTGESNTDTVTTA